ncbi:MULTISPECIES: hypothetical protein [Lachnospiraceae]|jgi:NTP pyrophosphatase (non-canonical NTP hydrolase)|uniref:hypothetical protein n=1 Tax=Lachnospiraceae TaxID=186803 RepID=UPI001231B367|nr:hypothetical protein [[Clostridium] symbiosum]KAA6138661.1 hypothetical protein F2P57_02100 [[Clostridium] symbiosum]DAG12805.1 MAG TPA: nucleoside triphosphate pyrophosphohydrolase [Caudoviricetes sp.]
MDNRIERIAEEYGYDAQSRQCIEEMAELTQAINKFWRKQHGCGKVSLDGAGFRNEEYQNLVEEIADVQIMLEQMKIFLDCDAIVREVMDNKLKRQIERITEKKV